LFCWRFGSIEWSENLSILVLPKQRKKYFNAYYITINSSYFSPKITFENPYLKVYKVELENKSILDFENCLTFTSEKIDRIITDGNYTNSEGRCSNSYFIKDFGDDKILLINKNSSNKLKKLITTFFNQISAQEHFQSFSLYKNCEELNSLSNQLLTKGTFDDKKTYCIDFLLIKHVKKRL